MMVADNGGGGSPTSSAVPTCLSSPINLLTNPFGTVACIANKAAGSLGSDMNKAVNAAAQVLSDINVNLNVLGSQDVQNKSPGATSSPTQTTTPTSTVAPQIYVLGGQGGAQSGQGNSDAKASSGSPLDALGGPLVIGLGALALVVVLLLFGGKK